jgi:hypothetical protein
MTSFIPPCPSSSDLSANPFEYMPAISRRHASIQLVLFSTSWKF